MYKFFKIFAVCLLMLTTACSDEKTASSNTAENVLSAKIYAQGIDEPKRELNVELADTSEKIGHGLMGRNSLDENSGMLFDINLVPKDMDIAFWMKDTLIPLDILFIDGDGTIFFIHKQAQPHDETPIYPPKRPRAVLEINGGQVDQYGINVGDMLKADLLGNN